MGRSTKFFFGNINIPSLVNFTFVEDVQDRIRKEFSYLRHTSTCMDDHDDDDGDDDDDDDDAFSVVVAVPGEVQALAVYLYI